MKLKMCLTKSQMNEQLDDPVDFIQDTEQDD